VELWKQFPDCYILVGDLDSLCDDARELKELLDKWSQKGKSELKIVKGAAHVFLNLEDMCIEGKEGIRQSANWLKAIVNK